MTKPSSSRKMTETTVDEARKATVPNSVDRIGIAAANSADRRAEKPRRLLMASTFKPVPTVPSELARPMHSATMIPVVARPLKCPRRTVVRRVWIEGVSTCRTQRPQYHDTKKLYIKLHN